MMKRVIYIFLMSLLSFSPAIAQQPASARQLVISPGTKIDYRFFLYGQTVGIGMTVRSVTDSVQLDWNLRGMATGSYLISKAGFEHGTKINFVQPAANTVLRLEPDETFGMISREAFKELKKNKKFSYNNTTYVLQEKAPFKMGELSPDVFHVIGQEENAEMWILDNPDFPLVCQIKNNPLGINFTITGIK